MAYKNLVEWAIAQIGQGNGPGKSNRYTEWFYGKPVVTYWCAIWVTCGFYECGIYDRIKDVNGKAGCENWRRWAIQKGIWSKTPKVGSLVLYDWNPKSGDGADHIGVVEKIVDGGIYAIEGNTSENGSQSNGGYVLRKRRYNSDVMGYIHVDTTVTPPKPKPSISFNRISGKNRYETSKETIKYFSKSFNSIIVVNGKSFADAMSASTLSKDKQAPILLTSNELINDTITYITKNSKIKTVYLIGGEGVISKNLENGLIDKGYEVIRFSGSNRYETNLNVLKACTIINRQLLVVSGENFPDGLCAGMINRPVLLVKNSLTTNQLNWIKDKNFNAFYIMGGTGAVSNTVEKQLKEFGETPRYFGNNRYATSTAIAKKFFPSQTSIIFASGKDFADGLCACNLGSYPLILIDNNFTYEARKYLTQLNPTLAKVIGGTGVIDDINVNWALTKLDTVAK